MIYWDANPAEHPFSLSDRGAPIPDPADAQNAVGVATKFLLSYDTLDSTKLVPYLNSITKLMTTKFQGDKQATLAGLRTQFQGDPIATKGVILESGINSVDGDTASVLVLHVMETATKAGNFIQNNRTMVTLRKVNGSWLVDSVANYSGSAQNGAGQ